MIISSMLLTTTCSASSEPRSRCFFLDHDTVLLDFVKASVRYLLPPAGRNDAMGDLIVPVGRLWQATQGMGDMIAAVNKSERQARPRRRHTPVKRTNHASRIIDRGRPWQVGMGDPQIVDMEASAQCHHALVG